MKSFLGKTYKVLYKGKKIEMTYIDICNKLCLIPECKFVKITTSGTISFTLGKPYEIKALLYACRQCGFTPSRVLIDTVENYY